ncbi:MAG TPA: hypothetical protein VN719_09670 [Gemmatimonadales bacterium]|nr:hypothetical protein [Gemmatimonadales bacterium]
MILHHLFKNADIRLAMQEQAAGIANVNGNSIDTLGYDAVAFVGIWGALTATQVSQFKVQGSNDNATWTDIAGSHTTLLTDGQSHTVNVIDVYRTGYRYLRLVALRATANAVIDGAVAILYHNENSPSAFADASVASAPTFVYLATAGTP